LKILSYVISERQSFLTMKNRSS